MIEKDDKWLECNEEETKIQANLSKIVFETLIVFKH